MHCVSWTKYSAVVPFRGLSTTGDNKHDIEGIRKKRNRRQLEIDHSTEIYMPKWTRV